MVGTFRLLSLANARQDLRAWSHGSPDAQLAPHRMVPFWYPSIVIWREWSKGHQISDVRLCLHGPQPNPYFYAPEQPTELIGIAIAPELTQRVLNVANEDAAGQIADWKDERFDDALALAQSGAGVAHIAAALMRPILDMLTPAAQDDINRAISMMRRMRGTANLRAIRERVGLSERHFRAKFKSRVGLSAKGYSRIIRANAIIAEADRTSAPDWASLSNNYGFFDQAHMINDLRDLTGQSPAALNIERKAE